MQSGFISSVAYNLNVVVNNNLSCEWVSYTLALAQFSSTLAVAQLNLNTPYHEWDSVSRSKITRQP